MHKSPVWLCFLTPIAIVAVWFTYTLSGELWTYFAMDRTTLPVTVAWRVVDKSSDRFYLAATYQYEVNGKRYFGNTSFDQTNYRTSRAADQMLLEENSKEIRVWYSSKDPSISSLLKVFPVKNSFYTAILWGLLLYFGGLSLYVDRRGRA